MKLFIKYLFLFLFISYPKFAFADCLKDCKNLELWNGIFVKDEVKSLSLRFPKGKIIENGESFGKLGKVFFKVEDYKIANENFELKVIGSSGQISKVMISSINKNATKENFKIIDKLRTSIQKDIRKKGDCKLVKVNAYSIKNGCIWELQDKNIELNYMQIKDFKFIYLNIVPEISN